MAFPPGFRFGVASASYQIEGAVQEDGRLPSIWDTFAHMAGKIAGHDHGDIAIDHYHRWREDVELMAGLGIDSYRLSLAWPRILPAGRGEVNPAGIKFYRELLTDLRARGIRPIVTLYHWDLPQVLQDEGGWAHRATAFAFADYARVVARELGDLVDLWITLNEPWCVAFLGYAAGVHAPGHKDPAEALAAAHHLNLAHGLAAQVIREELPDAKVGISLNLQVTRPEFADDEGHLAAVRRIDHVANHIFLGPLLEGSYPPELVTGTRDITDWAFVKEGDLAIIRQRLDVLGVNYYSTQTVRPGNGVAHTGAATPWVGAEDVLFLPPTLGTTAMGWEIDPTGLFDLLMALTRFYPGLPLLITENGAAFDDELVRGDHGATVGDPRRIDYLRRHLEVVEQAIEHGAEVQGYMLWTIIDNFEWAEGYSKRFGLIYVDFESLERIPKESYDWYRKFIAAHRVKPAAIASSSPGQAGSAGAVGEPAAGVGPKRTWWESWFMGRGR